MRGGGFGGFGGFGNTENKGRSREAVRGVRRRRPEAIVVVMQPRGAREEASFTRFSDFGRTWRRSFLVREEARPGRPRTLWEELEALGEELVDFLEEERARGDDDFDGPVRSREANDVLLLLGKCAEEGRDGERVVRLVVVQDRELERFFRHGGSAPPPKRESVDEMLDQAIVIHKCTFAARGPQARDAGVARGGTRASVSFVETENAAVEKTNLRAFVVSGRSPRRVLARSCARDELIKPPAGRSETSRRPTRKARTFVVALSTVARATRHTRRWRRSRTS